MFGVHYVSYCLLMDVCDKTGYMLITVIQLALEGGQPLQPKGHNKNQMDNDVHALRPQANRKDTETNRVATGRLGFVEWKH